MSSDLTSLIYRVHPPHLTPDEKLTMLALSDYAGATGKIFPTYEHLCLKTCIKRRTQISVVKSLSKKGFLAKVHRFKDVNGKMCNSSNAYCLNYELLIKLAVPIKRPQEAPPEFNFAEYQDPVLGDSLLTPPVQEMHPASAVPALTSCKPCTQNSSLNSSLNKQQQAEKEEQERALAMAKLAELQKGEQAKLRSRPRPEPEQDLPFRYEPTVIHPIAEEDKQLSDELYDEGVSKGCILALLRAYPNRAHIRQSLKKLRHAIKTKGVERPDGFMRHVMNDPYEEERISKTALKEVDRAKQMAIEEQKRKEAWEAGERRKRALQANPAFRDGIMAALRNANKRGKAEGLTAH